MPHKYKLLILLYLLPAGASHADPAVHWQERNAVVFIENSKIYEVQGKYKLYGENFVHVNSSKKGNYYRIPIDIFKKMDPEYRILISDPPFSWIEPEILRRRTGEDEETLWNGYKDEIISDKILHLLNKKYPEYTKLTVIGKSIQGRPILALKVSKNPDLKEDEPSFLFGSALHGNEPISIDYVLNTAKLLLENTKTKKNKSLLRAVNEGAVWFIPVINPDGVHIFWNKSAVDGRKNARDTAPPAGWNKGDGVDLNRNFPFQWNSGHREASSGVRDSIFFRGDGPGSEPEVRAVMQLAESERFVLSFTFHTFATKILTPYTIEGAMNPYPNNTYAVAEMLAGKGKSHRKNKPYRSDKNLYPVDGTDQDWFYNTYGTFAYTVEGSYQTPFYDIAKKSVEGMMPVSIEMLELYFRGPTLIVHTVDDRDRPVSADLKIAEIAHLNGEKLQTENNFGRFDFLLLNPDTYTIIAEKKGFQRSVRKIKCKKGIQEITVKMIP